MSPANKGSGTRPVEDRRLKAVGLTGVVIAAGLFAWLAGDLERQLPLALDRFVPFAAVAVLAVNLLAAGILVIVAGCGAGRALRNPRRRRAIGLQIVLANALVPALLYGMLSDDPAFEADLAAQDLDVVVAIVGTVLVALAWRLWRRSRRYEAPDADEAMALDPRPPVLYLRSFADDGQAVIHAGGMSASSHVMKVLSPVTPEQEMADILDRVGPLVAIGKPGEPLPELGAARLYVDHDRWQAKVTELMRAARLVVVRVGASPGVLWEIERALDSLPRQRLVLAVLGGATVAPELRARLASVLGPSFEAALPQPPPSRWKALVYSDPRRRIGGLICFGPDGRAFPVAVRVWPVPLRDLLFVAAGRPSAAPLRGAWRQVFAHLGLAWHDSRRRRSRGVAVLLAVFFGWLGGQWFYLGNRRRAWLYILTIPLMMAPLFMSFADALRFIWVDRADFEARFVSIGDRKRRA